MHHQLRSLALILFRFGTEQTKTPKKFINIAKMLQQQKAQQSSQNSNSPLNNPLPQKPSPHNNPQTQADVLEQLFNKDWQQKPSEPSQSGYSHMSTQEQQINHKIKSAIRSQSIYHECTKKKHKLEPRHYALMFCKVLQLRKNIPKQRKQTQAFVDFLKIVEKKLIKMPPEQLVRIVFAMKREGVNRQQIKLFRPIIQNIINQFSNTQNTEFDPKSFETFRLSTSIRLFKSLGFLLEQTGSHFEHKIKQIMNEMLNYILFESMKTKKQSKTGEYFPPKLKMNFLSICKDIGASAACIRNLIISVLVQRQRLPLDTFLDLEAIIFATPDVMQRTRHQLFIQKEIHLKYNIFYRIEHYIQNRIPSNLKNSSNYALLTKKLVKHLSYISQFTFQELKIMQMNSHKDEQVTKVLNLFHEAYRNCLTENFTSINDKQDAMAFFNKCEYQEYALYELLNFFYLKLKYDGPNSLRPSAKKELKDLVSLLTKFYGKLSFLTQSIIIELLIMSNFSNTKHAMIEFLSTNTLTSNSSAAYKAHFFSKNKQSMTEKFFQMIKYESSFRQNCPVQYEVFMKSNLKSVIKFVFKSKQQLNTEKYSFYLASYCRPFNQQQLKSFVDQVISLYMEQSWLNRSFKKDHVDVIYKNQDYFLSTQIHNETNVFQNQTDIFGEKVTKYSTIQTHETEKLLPSLQNDKEVMREFYLIDQKIRHKLRNLHKNFKFLIMFLENIKLTVSKEIYQTVINEELYKKILSNFKSELECMKFQRFLTKQNCTEMIEIYEFMKELWNHTDPEVQIRNEFLMYKNQQLKDNLAQNNDIDPVSTQVTNEIVQGQETEKQSQELLDEEEDQSEEYQYTQEIQYLKGKDLIQSDIIKAYRDKQQKSDRFFMLKNQQSLSEIKKITKDFTELPKTMQKVQQKIKILTNLEKYYLSGSINQTKDIKVLDLSFIDSNKIIQQNLNQVLSIQLQNSQNRVIYTFKVYTKKYPTLQHISQFQKSSDLPNRLAKIYQSIYFVHSSKLRRNKKRLEEISQVGIKETKLQNQSMESKQSVQQERVSQTQSQNINKGSA